MFPCWRQAGASNLRHYLFVLGTNNDPLRLQFFWSLLNKTTALVLQQLSALISRVAYSRFY